MNQLSPWHPGQLVVDTEPALRGSLALAVRDWVDARLSSGSFANIARRHDSHWPETLVASAWYPVRPVIGALELALSYGESIDDVLQDIATRRMPELLRAVLGAQGSKRPTALLQQANALLRAMVDFGSVETELDVHGLYEAWIRGIPHDLDALVRGLWLGLGPALVAEGFVKDARCSVVLCEQGVLGKRMYVRCRYR